MQDPINMPAKSTHQFHCIHLETGHVRAMKVMTAMIAARINNFNHTRDTGYMWLFNDQHDFNDQLDYGNVIVEKAG